MVYKNVGILQEDNIVPYSVALAAQRQLIEARVANPDLPDLLWLLEHPPVYTLGAGASLEYLKFNPESSPWELHRIERGGEVTYHCPGQIVGYAILNLRRYRCDLHWYLRQLEEVIIRLIALYGQKAERIDGLTGVWLKGHKVAAIGIKVRRWITMHGFALNVCPDLEGFKAIVPCGIEDKPVGSLSQFIPELQLEQVKNDLKAVFEEVFDIKLDKSSP